MHWVFRGVDELTCDLHPDCLLAVSMRAITGSRLVEDAPTAQDGVNGASESDENGKGSV